MYILNLLATFIASATIGNSCPITPASSALQIKTDNGVIHGLINSTAPNVRNFLGVPFALPPTGFQRWEPPFKLPLQPTAIINATSFGPSCAQQPISANSPSVYTSSGGGQTEFFPLDDFSEDCLTLNIFAPQDVNKPLPVFVWYFGGGFVQGGTSSLYFNPQSWVQRTQKHIVVTVNFRSNIFGFPNTAELHDNNLGILDQRASLEWVRDNIAKFGGDASKIVIWGQSAGALSCDFLSFGYPDDPIMSGMILESVTALYPTNLYQSFDAAQANFSAIATAFGCNSAKSPINCLKNETWQDIRAAMIQLNLTSSFLPIADERVVFSNYTQRYEMGIISSVPALVGNDQHEVNALIVPTPGVALNQTSADVLTNATFICTSAKTASFRELNGRTTYRFRYDGNFSNISPPGYPGAYHAADLPLVFGTAGVYHGPSTTYQDAVSKAMQDMWLEFAKDPENGLRNAGWASYSDGKAVVIGASTEGPIQEIEVSQIDITCNIG